MTATNVFFSTTTPEMDRPYTAAGSGSAGSLNMDVSDDATDFLSLRIMVYTTGTTRTNVTKEQVEKFLEVCRQWLHDQDQGLDYLLAANSVAAPIP